MSAQVGDLESSLLPALPREQWRPALRGWIHGEPHFQELRLEGWRGHFLRVLPLDRPWSRLGDARVSAADWQAAWPTVVEGAAGAWPRFKEDGSGVVAHGRVVLGGRSLGVVAKRPRRTRASQWVMDLLRPARARRAWIKTWKLLVRGLPTEIPLAVLERRSGGIVLDNLVLFERVPGTTLFHLDLASLGEARRRRLLQQVGATLRRTDDLGFTHIDAKTSNWIAYEGPGPGQIRPVMLDCDGVRHYRYRGRGLERFLRAMAHHPQFHPADAINTCDGYAPEGYPRYVKKLCEMYGNRGEGRADAVLEGRLVAGPDTHTEAHGR